MKMTIFKRNLSVFLTVLLLLTVLECTVPSFAEEKQYINSFASTTDVAVDDSGRMKYIVSSNNETKLEKFVDKNGGEMIENEDNYAVVALSEDEIKTLSTDSSLIIEPDVIISAEGVEEEAINTVVNEKWNVEAVGADISNTDETDTVKVAVIDSGVDYGEDVNIAQSVSLIDDGSEDFDVTGHGTAIEGIIGASDNDIGTTGVAPGTEIYSIRALDDENRAPVSRIIEALQWCIDNEINIVNLSMGTTYDITALHNKIADCAEEGILIIASSGNVGSGENVLYPAAYDEVFAVGATNSGIEPSTVGILGDEVDIMAPGENVPLNSFYDGVTVGSGTSYAAAHITGIAARLWAMDNSKSADFIKELIKVSAVPLDEAGCGAGLADLEYAKAIYSDFEEEYQTTNSGEQFSNDTLLTEYDMPAYLEANWYNYHHAHLVTVGSTETSLSDAEINLLKKASRWSDDELDKNAYTNGYLTDPNGFHFFHSGGKTNYVAVTKYLYNVAVRVKNGVSIANATGVTVYHPSNASNENYGLDVEAQKLVLDEGISAICNATISGQSNVTSTAKRNGLKILGLALHVAEDAYAHKSMVPAAEWDSTIRSICADYYSTSELDRIETKVYNNKQTFAGLPDLKNGDVLILDYDLHHQLHHDTADCITVCAHRYNRASKWACTKMMTWFDLSNNTDRHYFTAEAFYPNMNSSTYYSYKLYRLKFNLLKTYSNTLPTLGGVVTQSDWEALSACD